VKRTAEETLRIDPADGAAQHAREIAQSVSDQLLAAEREARPGTNADAYLKLSVEYFKNRRFEDSIRACRQALALRPDLAEAYSNLAAAEYALGRLDETEAALRETLRLRPDLRMAQDNLDIVLKEKAQPKANDAKLPVTP
jgi:tetratricopeptide (TPR) repeat protein